MTSILDVNAQGIKLSPRARMVGGGVLPLAERVEERHASHLFNCARSRAQLRIRANGARLQKMKDQAYVR